MKINTLIGSVALGLTAVNALTDEPHHETQKSLQLRCDHPFDETGNRDPYFYLSRLMSQAHVSGVATLNRKATGDVLKSHNRVETENLVGCVTLLG